MSEKAENVTKWAHRAFRELKAAHKVIEATQELPRTRALRVIGAAAILHGFEDIARHCAELAETLDAGDEEPEPKESQDE